MSESENLSPVKRALLEIRELRAQLEALEAECTEPIAIVGMGCNFPGGANGPAAYWQLLKNGINAITPIPQERWDIDAYYDANPATPGKMYTKGGGFLEKVDHFDAAFFGISPREAVSMDPQQRLLLETSWQALEHAGITPQSLDGSQTGVFIGVSTNDYGRLAGESAGENIDVHYTTGNNYAVAAGRLAYFYGFHGPAMSIDTACSSSLVALHQAIRSLRAKESNLALVGGVNLILSPETTVNFCQSGMLAPDDLCKTFDAAANGYVRSEGVGIVVLKRLSDAVANGDTIFAVIRGSAVNQDGRTSGLTAPNGPAQESVMRAALANAGVEAHEVGYVEAHGTGTPLGDPIEVQALANVLGKDRPASQPLLIGSAKTNLGHTEAAAGMAGLIKAVLALHHGEIPPSLNFQQPNPFIAWEKMPVRVVTQATAWPLYKDQAYIGLSSFGFSGTNAHVILGAAPLVEAASDRVEPPTHLFTLSAKTPAALHELAENYAAVLTNPSLKLGDLTATANAGRTHFAHRLALIASDAEELHDALNAFVHEQAGAGQLQTGYVPENRASSVAFLFSGQGTHYVQMARRLYECEPSFRAWLDECNTLSSAYLPQPLLDAIYPRAGDGEMLQQMRYAQPAIFAIEYALARLWRAWGIQPAFVLGHSVGEYAAACIAGVFSLEDALLLVTTRGRLMDGLREPGKMVTVFADEATVAPFIEPYSHHLSIAAVNGPDSVVISGQTGAIDTVLALLKTERIRTRALAVTQASHSPLMEPLLDEFEAVARRVNYQEPLLPIVSTVTGDLIQPGQISQAAYWREHTRRTVQFARAMQTLQQLGARIFVEIGPNPTLLTLGQRCIAPEDTKWLPSLRQGFDDWQQMLESLAALYVGGVHPNWGAFESLPHRRRVALPTYPFQRQRYWIEQKAQPHHEVVESLWEIARAAAESQSTQGPLDLNAASYPAKWQAANQLAHAYQTQTLRALGAFTQAGEAHTLAGLLTKFEIDSKYEALLGRWLDTMVTAGWLRRHDELYISDAPLPATDIHKLWHEIGATLEEIQPLADYLRRSGELLAAVLTGVESPLETLFPGGDYDTVDFLYNNWALPRYFNGIVAKTVAAASRQPSKRLQVLEIGAGTGGTTATVLPALPANRLHYTFTDVSDFFLGRAQARFAAFPFVRYHLLDIEQEPTGQGFAANSFDIVIAANVLHATSNLDQTLQHLRSLLAPGGLLILYEATEHPAWFDITVGLIEGWSKFEDSWRGDHPLLTGERWMETLYANGFESVELWPKAGNPARNLLHTIVLAQGPNFAASAVEAARNEFVGTEFVEATSVPEVGASSHLHRQLDEALPGDRVELMIGFVRDHVRRGLRVSAAQPLSIRDRLMDLGFDSLMAVELRAKLSSELGLTKTLPATLIFDYPTIEAMAKFLLKRWEDRSNGAELDTPELTTTELVEIENMNAPTLSDLTEMSDDEIEALLLKKLENI